jgi:hypothetical protein
MRVRTLSLAAAIALIALSGCQKVKVEKTATIEPANYYELTVDPPRSEQKVSVTVTPSNGPVSAYLIKADGVLKVRSALEQRGKEPPAELVFGKHVSTTKEEFTFEGTVPAKTEYMLLLKNGAATKNDVSIKLVGR